VPKEDVPKQQLKKKSKWGDKPTSIKQADKMVPTRIG